MDAKHTPGPWRLDDPNAGRNHVLSEDYHSIDGGVGFLPDDRHEQGFGLCAYISLADARLLTAAPELLDALKEYDAAFTELDPESAAGRKRMRLAVIKARAAIKKATGTTHD